MQTFLPYPSFTASAKCLDNKRLGKQRVEAIQILRTLLGQSSGWKNHPATKMWKGHELSLLSYAFIICGEWMSRGFANTKCTAHLAQLNQMVSPTRNDCMSPFWFGKREFHDAHKSNLLRKDPIHYGQFHWDVPNDLPYVWPCGGK